eukprot:TRINITY_DN10461_c0_g1_i1.p1 TRINITY_DN10461_c0_g1~~TRINITY_DN10461_c0_g1_i1.p1  ORF type:complete len:435 (-),score=149.08 TRINITY_DN10461_c0_g1_i1:150-1454(-)
MKDIEQTQPDLMCPISREPFNYPLLCTDGFSYEKPFIEKWVVEHEKSPMAGILLESKELRENKVLLFYINAYKGLSQRLTKRVPKTTSTNHIKESFLANTFKKKYQKVLDHYYKSTIELEKCCSMIEEVYKASPNNFQVIMDYANILRFSMRFEDSLEMIERLRQLRPGSLIPEYMQVRVLMEKGNRDEGNKHMAKVQAENKIEDHTLLELRFMSYSSFSTGNSDHAYKIISAYLQIVPKDPRALSHFIYMNLLKENYKLVVRMSKKYLKEYQNDISILFHLAKAYTCTNKKSKAILVYKKITAVSADKTLRAKALYESAIIRDASEDFEEMVKELEESYKLDPREEADGYLAALYTDRSQYDKAEEWINICGKRTDIMNDQVFLGIKAQIQENKNEFDEAIKNYLRLAEIDNANYLYYNNKIEEILGKMKDGN